MKVETEYIEGSGYGRGYYKKTVLEAVDRGGGVIELGYAQPASRTKLAKTNKTNYLTYNLKAGFVVGRRDAESHNINFDNVKAFSGQTYDVKDTLKSKGFRWRNGRWEK